MPFKSEAQRRYFYYKASQPGEEGKKWKKHLRKYRESTPKGVKLPERVKTASKEKIAVGKEVEMLGHLLRKTRFKKKGDKLVATGQGMQKKILDALLTDVYPKQKSFLSEKNKKRAASLVADFFADPIAYAASATPFIMTGYPIPGAGVAYVAGRHKLLQALNKAPKPSRFPDPIKTASQAALEQGFVLELEKIIGM